MRIRLAKTAGFCFGVQRAVETVYDQVRLENGEPIFTFGPIIHNQEVIKDMESKGIKVLKDEEELKKVDSGVVIIRSHGVSKHIYQLLKDHGIKYIDATCPFVKKIHTIVSKAYSEGESVVIIGDATHPEVRGISGWTNNEATVIKNVEEASFFTPGTEQKVCIVSQTTFNYNKFTELVEIISRKSYDVSVLNTICNATRERQEEARCISETADAMIVIGDIHSSNTRKLFEICLNACEKTYYIQTKDDLDISQISPDDIVGITAGASTPNTIIEEVQNYVRINF